MPNFNLTCTCGRIFTIDTVLAGTKFTCPTCGKSLAVPADAVAEPRGDPFKTTAGVAAPREQLAKKRKKKPLPPWVLVGGVGVVLVMLVALVPQGIKEYHASRITRLNAELTVIPQKQREATEQQQKQIRGTQLYLTITGPKSLQPGAPNRYRVTTSTLNDENVPVNLTWSIKDKSGKELAREAVDSEGNYEISVPVSTALRPNDEITLEVTAKRDAGAESLTLSEQLPLEQTGYLTHLFTDKPLYQPGEVVSFRSLTLQRFSLQAPEEDLQLSFTVVDPSGQVIFRHDGSAALVAANAAEAGRYLQGPDSKSLRGIGVSEFAIPANAPGGEYKLTVSERRARFAPEVRSFLVQRYQSPRLHKELEFTRRSFGPGDEVLAACKVKRIEGDKPLADQPVIATVLLDGKRLKADGTSADDATIAARTDSDGQVALKFRLPKEIEYGEASLAVQFTDGGNVETLVRPIPIVVRRLRVDFYPEGGDLVAGVPNRVYFAARTPLGKPADIRGRVLDGGGKVAATLATFTDETNPAANQGAGIFMFTPQVGHKYELQIDAPAGLALKHPLPAVKDSGVVLRVETGVTNDAEPLKATVASATVARKLLIAVCCRGRIVGTQEVTVAAGEVKTVSLLPPAGLGGVYRLTVFDDQSSATVAKFVPVAERLVFRQPAHKLHVSIGTDKPYFVPGDKVRLAVDTTDETKKPVPAIALVSVVDKAALSLADDKTLRQMPTHFLLTTEVRRPEDLEHADFLLSSKPSAAVAVDLLLGTQGWRRFAEQDPKQFRDAHGADAGKLLASSGQAPVRTTNKSAVERATQPLLLEAARKAQATFVTQQNKLRTEAQEASRAELLWRERSEMALAAGILGLFAVMFLTGVVAALTAVADAAAKRSSIAWLPATLMLTGCVLFCVVGLFSLPVLTRSGTTFSEVASDFSQNGTVTRELARKSAPADMAPPMAPPGPGGGGPGPGGKSASPTTIRPGMPPGPGMPGMSGASAPPLVPDGADTPAKTDADASSANLQLTGAPGSYDGPSRNVPGESARRRYAEAQRRQAEATAAAKNRTAVSPDRSFRDVQRDARTQADADSAPPFTVREYAHQNEPRPGSSRSDFTEVVYWHPVLVMPGGSTTVQFHVSDALTSFRALAFVHSTDGRLGAAQIEFASRLPFSVDAKIPGELTAGDELHLPVVVANDTDMRRQVKLQIEGSGLKRLDDVGTATLNIDADKRSRALFKFTPNLRAGESRLRLNATSDFHGDQIDRSIRIAPAGFPVLGAHSGTDAKLTAKIVLPKDWTPGSLSVRAEVYPSVLADIQTGLDGMLREPYGCFEQTSSTSYPNLLVLQYLQQTGQARPEIARRALHLLERGYQRLLTFECPAAGGGRQGYEWFGGPVPHEALTAYGLLQFHDLSKVYDRVDAAMMERTRQFLLAKRNGAGTFNRRQDYHRFGQVSPAAYNAYLVWALTESETDADLNKETQWLIDQSQSNDEPYFLALTANSLLLRNHKADGAKVLDKLAALQNTEGALNGRESIVGGYGRDLHIEATALAVLAWLKAEQPQKYREPLAKAVGWLTRQRSNYGGFGATQATILTLKALVQIAKDARKLTPGDVIVSVRGQPLLRRSFLNTAQDTLVIELPDAEKLLQAGDNDVRLELTGGNELPMKLSWQYHALQPPSAAGCPVTLTTKLDKSVISEGDIVRLSAVVANASGASQGMAVAIIGLPAGLTLPEDLKQLTDLAKPRTPLAGRDVPEPGVIDYFEIRGRELILYWRGLDVGQKIEVPIDLIGRVPGNYNGPASRAYLYYGADAKCWTAPLAVKIEAK